MKILRKNNDALMENVKDIVITSLFSYENRGYLVNGKVESLDLRTFQINTLFTNSC